MQPQNELLISFLDAEPPMIGGSTLPEFIIVIKAAALVNLGLAVFLALLIGVAIPLIIGFVFIFGTFITVWIVVKWLKGHKRGKPPEFFLQWASKKMASYGLAKPLFISRNGYWY